MLLYLNRYAARTNVIELELGGVEPHLTAGPYILPLKYHSSNLLYIYAT
jgi:hypothetical protein